ncbi:hypothetical protein L2Y00_06820 [Pseudomonas avellanae]|nr:hypothetical protein [Pseudomonas avellanae]UQW70176.1 hypothetical protein L2Y00_06820 [Pseudomonas avellanae]
MKASKIDAYFRPSLEGALREVKVNVYERDDKARKACIRHHKAVCAACKLDFGSVYGEIAKGLIHVHHIVPLSTIGAEYKLDPITEAAAKTERNT